MKVPDLNLLLYAINADAPRHAPARRWLESTLSGRETVGFAWPVVLGFLRLSTMQRIFERPLPPAAAVAMVDEWLHRPCSRMLVPGPEHWLILKSLLTATGTAGNLTTDAHLAALAIENGAELCSADSDFARFPRLVWTNPLV